MRRLRSSDTIEARVIFENVNANLAQGAWFFFFYSVCDLPEALIRGQEELWLRHTISSWAHLLRPLHMTILQTSEWNNSRHDQPICYAPELKHQWQVDMATRHHSEDHGASPRNRGRDRRAHQYPYKYCSQNLYLSLMALCINRQEIYSFSHRRTFGNDVYYCND